jgi:hypothetical protein
MRGALGRRAAFGLLVALIAFPVGPPPPPLAAQTSAMPVEVLLSLDRVGYEPGMPISFTILIKNNAATPTTLSFPTSQGFDLILHSGDLEFDRWSRGRTFAQRTTDLRLAPGEVIRYSDTWTPSTALLPGVAATAGQQQSVSRGVYRLVAQLATTPPRPTSRTELIVYGQPTQLPEGCSTLPAPYPLELPATTVAGTIDPPAALKALWQRTTLFGDYAGLSALPAAANANDLQTVNRRFPLTICLSGPARMILP